MKRGAERTKDRRTMDAILQMKREEKRYGRWREVVKSGVKLHQGVKRGKFLKKVKKKAKENIIPDGRARQKPGSQKKSFGESEIFD